MDTRPVVVIATADDCPHCTVFKRSTLPGLLQALANDNRVRVVRISLAHMADEIDPSYPRGIRRLIFGFPSIMLFNGIAWNSGVVREMDGLTFNAAFEDGTLQYVPRDPFNTDGIMSWINRSLGPAPTAPARPAVRVVGGPARYHSRRV